MMSQRLISWKICYFKHISKALSGENDGPIKVAVSSLHYCITSITLVVSNHKTYFWGRRNYLSRLNPMEAFFFIFWDDTKKVFYNFASVGYF